MDDSSSANFASPNDRIAIATNENSERRKLPQHGIFRILVCRVTHSLGNTLCLTPLIQELQNSYPGAEIDIVTRSGVANDVFGAFANVRRIFILPAHGLQHPFRYWQLLRSIRKTEYNLVIDPNPRSRTGRALLAYTKGREKLGFLSGRRDDALTCPVSMPPAPFHWAQLPVYLLRAAQSQSRDAPFPKLSIELHASERAEGREALLRVLGRADDTRSQPIIGIFPNATGTKLLPTSWWKPFLQTLRERAPNAQIVEIVPAFGRSMLDAEYPAIYLSDIRRLACVLSGLSLYISADCGVMHLACASGVPVVGIFSVTDASEWGPYGSADQVLNAAKTSSADLPREIVFPWSK